MQTYTHRETELYLCTECMLYQRRRQDFSLDGATLRHRGGEALNRVGCKNFYDSILKLRILMHMSQVF